MPDYPHKLLRNPQGIVSHFDGSRGFEDKDDDDDKEEPEKDYSRQKAALRQAYDVFGQNVTEKYEARTLKPSFAIDYVRIDFFVTFANTIEYSTKDIFEKKYGLHPVRFYNFNKSVLFEIADIAKFRVLEDLLEQFINSSDAQSPERQTYNIVTLIKDFRLLTAAELFSESLANRTGSLALQLTHQTESVFRQQKQVLEKELISYMQAAAQQQALAYRFEDRMLLVNGLSDQALMDIFRNFDLIASAQAIRIPKTIPSLNPAVAKAYDFNLTGINDRLARVLVMDQAVFLGGR